jgi:20S proteasome alpha/beta subunit
MEERQKLAEKTVLRRAGLDYNTFIEQQRNLTPELTFGLMSAYQDVKLDLELLIAGVDSSGGHLYQVTDPGIVTCFDPIGYSSIGSGLPHAEGFLTEADYSPKMSLKSALWLCYVAKRRSERAPGVGKATDALVVETEAGVKLLNDETLSKLKALYDEQFLSDLKRVTDNIYTSVQGLDLMFEKEAIQ